MTIRETIMDVVSRHGERVFLVDAAMSREITYGDFHRQACALAADLRRRGIHKGDRVAVMVPNDVLLLMGFETLGLLNSVWLSTSKYSARNSRLDSR